MRHIIFIFTLLGLAQAQTITVTGKIAITGTFTIDSSSPPNPYTTLASVDDITTITTSAPPGWQKCTLATSCGPGGTGTPSLYTLTFNDTTHTLDGAALKISYTDPANTNQLATYKAFGGTSRADSVNNAKVAALTHFICTYNRYPDSNSVSFTSEYEQDCGKFSVSETGPNTSDGTNFMFGSQCITGTHIFQLFNQAANVWVNATYSGGNVPCTVTANTFNNFVITGHIVSGDQSSCISGGLHYPMDVYDSVTINGTTYTITNTNTCAGDLNPTFSSLFFTQVQEDSTAGSGGTNMNEWIDVTGTQYY